MSPEETTEAQPVGAHRDPQQGGSQARGSGIEETRMLDLNAALGGALGQAGESAGAAETPPADLGDLFAGLLGGEGEGEALGLDGIVELSGVSKSALSAALPLVLGALLKPGQQQAVGESKPVGLAGLASLAAGGKPVDAASLEASGLPEELAKKTGIDGKTALTIIQAVLKALGVGKTTAKSKPKKKPKSAAKPKARPKAKAKPKAKPKPKTSSSTSSSKPKAKPKPKPTSRPASSKTKPKTTGSTKK